jgi:ribulose-5-phosphate 4-epimerase/fuculose-1-phosphate aldolase
MEQIDELRARVARACRVLGRLDLTKAAMGHVSARIPGTERVLIRARGPGELGVRYTEDDQIVEVGLDGELTAPNDSGLKSPIEIFIHTEIYRLRPDVYSVIHIHPPTAVLFTICDRPLLPLYGAFDPKSLQLVLDGIPTYERSILIDSPELGQQVARTIGGAPVCLMRGHGISTAAASIEEATLAAIAVNDLATMNYQAYLLGNPRPISREDQEAFRDLERAPVSENGSIPTGRPGALWRYYCAVTGADTD